MSSLYINNEQCSPQVCHYDEGIVDTLSPKLGCMQPALFLSLLDFSKHQTKVEMVETQDAHEAIQEYPCE